MLVKRTKMLAEEDISGANISQIWGICLLIFVMILSPILVILAKNAISSIQVFAVSVEKKSADMKKQKKKQDALIFKMLPRDVVEKLNSGADTAENFESATLFFSTVVDFALVTKGKSDKHINFCLITSLYPSELHYTNFYCNVVPFAKIFALNSKYLGWEVT